LDASCISQTNNFRHAAGVRLAQAKAERQSTDDERFKYTALELRLAIEGVTYDRAMGYKAAISPTELGTWQPKKLMQLLIDIEAPCRSDMSCVRTMRHDDDVRREVRPARY